MFYCGVSAIGALVYGYDNTYYNGVMAMQQFKNDYGTEVDASGNKSLASSFQSVTASSIYVGNLLGALIAAPINDYLGRKATFWFASVCILAGAVAQVADTHYEGAIILGRILIGVGVGQFTVTSLLYIGELAPTQIRGPAFMSFQFLQSLSQLVASGLTQGTESIPNSHSYEFPMGGLIVLPLFMFATLPFIRQVHEADAVLRQIHRSEPDYDPAGDKMEQLRHWRRTQETFWPAGKSRQSVPAIWNTRSIALSLIN